MRARVAAALGLLLLAGVGLAATTKEKTFTWTGHFRAPMGPSSVFEGGFKATLRAKVQISLSAGDSWFRQYSIDSAELRIPLHYQFGAVPPEPGAPPPPPSIVQDYLVVLASSDFDLSYASPSQPLAGSFVKEAYASGQGYGLYIWLSHPQRQIFTTPRGGTLVIGGTSPGEVAAFVFDNSSRTGVCEWPTASDFIFPPGYDLPYYDPRSLGKFALTCAAWDDGLTYQTVRFLDADDESRLVVGAVADGAARAIVEVHGVNQSASVTKPDADGTWVTDPLLENGTWRRTWQAPKDYDTNGGVNGEGRRQINFSIVVDGQSVVVPPFDLYQAPVLLLHGIWGEGGMWAPFERYLNNLGFAPWQRLAPSYPPTASFSANATVPLERASELLKKVKNQDLVAKKVDVVTYSMGGCLVKKYGKAAYIRKVATIGAPHLGSPCADFVLSHRWAKDLCDSHGRPTEGALEDMTTQISKNINGNLPGADVLAIDVQSSTATFPYVGLGIGESIVATLLWLYFPQSPLLVHGLFFGANTTSDWVVSGPSQIGGLSTDNVQPLKAIGPFDPLWHCTEAQDARVFGAVFNFLRAPLRGNAYTISQENAEKTEQPSEPITVAANDRESAGEIAITAPRVGTTVLPGSDVAVRVEAPATAQRVGIGFLGGLLTNVDTPPFECALSVPREALGALTIVAFAADDQDVIGAASVTVNARTSAAVTNLDVWPEPVLYLPVAETLPLLVEGDFADGIRRTVTEGGLGTTYASSKQTVATVSTNGEIFAIAPGFCFVTVRNGTARPMQMPLQVLSAAAGETNPPSVAITSPASNQRISATPVTVTGTARDDRGVASVWLQLNASDWDLASSTNGWTNWTASVTLAPGTNTLRAYAVDTSGNLSTTSRVSFVCIPTSRLVVQVNGSGSISPNYSNQALNIGSRYTLTAKPKTGYVFSNWTDGAGSVVADTPKLTFTMQSDLVLQANFIPNPFIPVAGAYRGLFYSTNGVAQESCGFFNATVSSLGAFSAQLQQGAARYSLSGQFSAGGVASNVTPRRGLSALAVQLRLDFSGGDVLTGRIDAGGWTAELVANRAVYSKANPAAQAGKYTMIFAGGDGSATQPGGYGFGTVGVDASGNASFSGTLGDGSKVTQQGVLSRQGQWPFYLSLYSGKGFMLGWLTFTNHPDRDVHGALSWLKLPQAGPTLYPAGFFLTNEIEAVGSAYLSTPGVRVLNLTNGMIVLENVSQGQSITNQFSLSANNKVTGPNKVSLAFTTSSGMFKGSVVNPATGKVISINGALVQKQNAGYGLFVGTNRTGSVYLGSR